MKEDQSVEMEDQSGSGPMFAFYRVYIFTLKFAFYGIYVKHCIYSGFSKSYIRHVKGKKKHPKNCDNPLES